MTSPGWIFEPQSREERQESLRKTLAESIAQEKRFYSIYASK